MKTRNAVINVDPDHAVILINVKVLDHVVTLDRTRVSIPWDFTGTVQWAIVAREDSATFHPIEGVKFRAGDAPFAPYPVTPTLWQMDVYNTNPAVLQIPFEYTLTFTDGNATLVDDPTVENDSPPMVAATPPARLFRRLRRIARTRV
jgi:hypothetical protein